MPPTAKADAIEAIRHARTLAERPALAPLELVYLRAVLGHAEALVASIHEAQRVRRKTETGP